MRKKKKSDENGERFKFVLHEALRPLSRYTQGLHGRSLLVCSRSGPW